MITWEFNTEHLQKYMNFLKDTMYKLLYVPANRF